MTKYDRNLIIKLKQTVVSFLMHASSLIAVLFQRKKKLVAFDIHYTVSLSQWLLHRQAALILSSEKCKILVFKS